MAWMSDAEYELRKDCMDKKITARSARSTRTHCGKRGSVKFPSDYLTEKEKKAMNGECKSYRMNDPITYKEFKTWPEEHQKTYIKLVRSKYKVPDKALADAMGCENHTLGKLIRNLNLGLGKGAAAASRWWDKTEDARAFRAWWYGICKESVEEGEAAVNENAEIETVDPKKVADEMIVTNEQAIPQSDIRAAAELLNKTWTEMTEQTEGDTGVICNNPYHHIPVIPSTGSMTFENNCAEDILATIKSLLHDSRVNMTISWEFIGGRNG